MSITPPGVILHLFGRSLGLKAGLYVSSPISEEELLTNLYILSPKDDYSVDLWINLVPYRGKRGTLVTFKSAFAARTWGDVGKM